MPVTAARGRRPLWVLAAAAPAPAVAAAPVPTPTVASFTPVSAPPRSRPPHVAPRSMAPVDNAASAATAAPALCVARLHVVAVRRPPRSGGGTRAAVASAGASSGRAWQVQPRRGRRVAVHPWQHDAALLYTREQHFHEAASHSGKYNEKQNELITDL